MEPEETQVPEEASVGDAVASLMQELPAPVQEFLASDERAQIVRDLSQKYSLHVDQAGDFEQALLFMLLGISTPDQFVEALKKAGLTQEVINGLVEDVNTQVFKRLRDAEQNPAPAPKPAPLPPPAIEYTPRKGAAPVLPGTSVPVPAPEPPLVLEQTPAPIPVHPTQIIQSAPPAAHPAGWHPAAAVHVYIPTHPAAHQPIPEPVQPVPEAPKPVPAPEPVRQTQAPTPAPTPASSPLEKTYSADPYREPVE